jgi:hypothetical protein
MARVQLNDIAYARSGDKGDNSLIGLMAKSSYYYEMMKREVFPERIKQHFGSMVKGAVEVYPMDNIEAMMVVLREGLDGGATQGVKFDQTGKAMSSALLRMWVNID